MILTYLKTSFRHLIKNRQFTLLNLIGLSTGLLCSLLICLWIIDELGVDQFHETNDRLYEVMIHAKNGNEIVTSNGTGDRVGETLVRALPDVEMAVTTTPAVWFQKFNLTAGAKTVSADGNFVGKDFFKAFSYPLLYGSPKTALPDKNSIVISEKLAKQLFPSSEQAIGKMVEWKWQAFAEKCMVTGVFKDFPSNSTKQYDFVLSLDAWKEIVPAGGQPAGSGPFNNFIVLKSGADVAQAQQKLTQIVRTTFVDSTASLFLRQYSDGYLYGKYENGVQAGGKIDYVRLFAVIALIILVIACINFMNLSTAKAVTRSREVGVKKALGAGRSSLVFQFLTESLLMSMMAMLIAFLLAWLLLPQFNAVTGKQLSLHFDTSTIAMIAVTVFVTGILAGSYPALYLSRFSPITTLKGVQTGSLSELFVRNGLVIFQFTISVVFIISVLVVYRQIDYIQHKSLGYDKENIIYFEMEGRAASQGEAFLAQLKSVPGIVNASSSQQKIILPSFLPGTGGGVRWEGKNMDDKVRFFRMPVNYDLIETVGIEMSEGRSFSRSFGDTSSIILNEAAIKAMELSDPIGKTMMFGGKERRIIGVTKNFHFNSLHEEIRPFILFLSPNETMLVMAKIAARKEKETIAGIQQFYKKFNPGYALSYKFLDQDYQNQYASEKLAGELVRYFALLAIIISCLGLFGLTAFTAERRKKEIGVRRVLGATVGNIVTMFAKDFLVLVLIAICIAFPIAWWLMNNWLQNFAYHFPMGISVFLGAAFLMIVITVLTVGYQLLKTALANPTQSLRTD